MLAYIFQVLILAVRFFGHKIIDVDDFFELIFRFAFNYFFVIVLVRYIYYKSAKRKDYLITYLLVSMTIFFLCYVLENVKLELGFALGLFAIFGIIRYRTSQIRIKEMTYLFMVIGLSVINALANKSISYAEMLFANLIILFVAWSLEKVFLIKHETQKVIVYDKIELIKRQNQQELIKDIEQRTGLQIRRIEVGRIDFLRDIARIKIFYFESENAVPDDAFTEIIENRDEEM